MGRSITRRELLALTPLLLVPRLAGAAPVWRRADPHKHPDPRKGITAAHVLPASRLMDKSAAPVYDMVRRIPEIVDGIRCNCGCADLDGYYSLLTCFEGGGMAQHCQICQGQARLAFKLHGKGWTLNDIRRSIDAQFGDR